VVEITGNRSERHAARGEVLDLLGRVHHGVKAARPPLKTSAGRAAAISVSNEPQNAGMTAQAPVEQGDKTNRAGGPGSNSMVDG
jgi:hypothetical protein